MVENKTSLLIGIAIIVFGILALLNNLGLLTGIDDIIGAVILFSLAYLFYRIYRKDPGKVWGLIVATFCGALALIVVVESLSIFPDEVSGTILFWSGAAVFAFLYVRDNRMWWAVIPAGILFTLGVVVLTEGFGLLNSGLEGTVLFLGFGLTFMYLYMQRNEQNKLDWAIWPGGFLLAFAVFVYLQNMDWMDKDFFLPVILIIIGGYLIYRASKRSQS